MSKVVKAEKSSRSKGLTRIGVLVSIEQAKWLSARSEATHIPLTAIVRLAIDAYRQTVERKAARKPAPAVAASEPLASIERPGPHQDASEALAKHGA
jgi:hypothetical protein